MGSSASVRAGNDDSAESVQEEIDTDWVTLNVTGLLEPMLREECVEAGGLRVRYHDPLYRWLFTRNLLERRWSTRHFATMFWRAVRERGGVELADDLPALTME